MAGIGRIVHGSTMRRLRIGIWIGAGVLLLLPAVAMQFTPEVRWTASDFVVFAGLLGIVCAGCEWLWRRTDRLAYLLGGAAALGAAFVLVWAELAVGIFS